MPDTSKSLSESALQAVQVADASAPVQAPPPGGLLSSLPMMLAILAIFYFLLIRPQQKEQKEHEALLGGLKKGDQVVTASGLHGKIWNVGEHVVEIEIADKVRVDVDKVSIKRRINTGEEGKG